MLKRISVLLVSALLVVLLAPSVALAAPDINGCSDKNDAVEDCETGTPTDLEGNNIANGFGAVTSQRASTVHDIGEHSSNPTAGDDQPRKGVGNVARTDGNLAGALGVKDPGASPGAHGCLIGQLDDFIGQDDEGVTSCTNDPGLPRD